MIEVFYNTSTGAITDYRAFRDYSGNYNPPPKGVKTLIHAEPLLNVTKSWTVPNNMTEYWADPNGNPACFNTQHEDFQGPVYAGNVRRLPAFQSWLQDKRPNSHNPNVWHDVEVIRKTEYWGNNYENYYYGRWFDPVVGHWRGLGEIKWEWFKNGQLMGSNEKHYVVRCTGLSVPCTTCPP